MRIVNLLEPIEPLLVEMASTNDTLEALKGQKLFELVQHLQARGPAPEACGLFFRGELSLAPRNHYNKVFITIWVDWQDYGPVYDGLPVTHYRLRVRRGSSLTKDSRAVTCKEAADAIYEAFGWSS